MRTALSILLVVGLASFARAESTTGSSVGAFACAGSGAQAGLAWGEYVTNAGASPLATHLNLSWQPRAGVAGDYDLEVYVGSALDDGALSADELVAASSHHGASHAWEDLVVSVPAHGQLVVVVIPWDAHGETYTLDAPGAGIDAPNHVVPPRGRAVDSAAPVPEQQGFFGFCPT